MNGTGVAILRRSSDGWLKPEYHTLWQKRKGPVTKTYQAQRLCTVANALEALNVFEDAALAAVEDYAMGIGGADSNGMQQTNCIIQLGELGGIVRYLLLKHHIPFIPCPIQTNKKFATGNGSAAKELVAGAMAALWSLPAFTAKQHDSSDALSLASVAAFKYYGGLPDLKTYRFQAPLVEPLEIVCAEE